MPYHASRYCDVNLNRPQDFFDVSKHNAVRSDAKDYELGDKLGKGAFGTVYEAINLKTKEKCAIKKVGIISFLTLLLSIHQN